MRAVFLSSSLASSSSLREASAALRLRFLAVVVLALAAVVGCLGLSLVLPDEEGVEVVVAPPGVGLKPFLMVLYWPLGRRGWVLVGELLGVVRWAG